MMWLTAAMIVMLFLAVVASLAALGRHGPDLWQQSMQRAHARRIAVSPKHLVPPAVSASEREVSAVSEFISPPETDAETAVADALARLIIADQLDLTIAVKIGAGKKSGEGYQKWSRLVKAAIARQTGTVTPIAERPTAAQFASDRRP
jgi:hypothetical protein